MRHLVLVALLLASALSLQAATSEPASQPAATQPSDVDLATVVITLRTQGGMLLESVTTINGNGSFTVEQGTAKSLGHVNPTVVKDLVAKFFAADFFNMKPEYVVPPGSRIALGDATTIWTAITINGKTTTVKDLFEPPAALRTLESQIQKAVVQK